MSEPKILGEVYLSGDEAKRILVGMAWSRIWPLPVYIYDEDIEEAEKYRTVSVKRFEDKDGRQGFAYSFGLKE